MFDLLGNHGAAVINLFVEKLNSRPKTLVHGDLHCGNMFKHKTDPNAFTFIDWQSCCNTAPAVEFLQMLTTCL